MKWVLTILLVLISCTPVAQEVTTKPVAEPIKQPIVAPTAEPVKQSIATPTAPPQPTPESKPALAPEEECAEDCEENCKATAQNSCTQKERSGCKDICNDNPVVDPSACTQACTYLSQPNVCKQQMEQFCSSQCVGYCH